ncbi:MAG: hypothetical protein WBB32_05325 [Flavobacteriales bacterium]
MSTKPSLSEWVEKAPGAKRTHSIPLTGRMAPLPGFTHHTGIPSCECYVYEGEEMLTMSRSYKIALILKSRSSLAVYSDLSRLTDRELEEHVRTMVRRMRANESHVIARMVLRQPTFSLN